MSAPKNHIFIVAGEASGDAHGAELITAFRHLRPNWQISGLGGEHMRHAGMNIIYDLTQIAVVGFWEIMKHYAQFKEIFDLFLKKVDEYKPQAVILIDYPGFNLRLAHELKKRNIKVIYYISPQIWAWKEDRIKQIKQNVDLMLVLFQFEVDFYKKHDFPVQWVGHPLLDEITVDQPRKMFLPTLGLVDNKLTIGLLPGSRRKEVEQLLPVMLQTARRLRKEFPQLQFLILRAPTIAPDLIARIIVDENSPTPVVSGQHYNALNACDVCLVASGTATLETAILGKPMVVIYKTSPYTYFLAKIFVKIPDIALVNVVAGKRIVPECLQHQANAQTIANELKSIFTNEIRISEIKTELNKVRESLGQSGASRRTAEKIVSFLNV